MKNLNPEEINQLRYNARSVVRELGLLNDAYFEVGVTLAERHLLIELSACKCASTSEIAGRLLLEKSTVSRLIARALKKGYITYSPDEKDKRKRLLQLTQLGKKTLHAFEPIAFNQTKNALSTLTDSEVDLVYQGVSLYAKGLRNARLKNNSHDQIVSLEKELPFGYSLKLFTPKDEPALYDIFREVVDSGSEFPYEDSSIEEFYNQFFTTKSQVYVCHCPEKKIVGGFYIRPNFSGRSNHIANAAYMVKKESRGKGIGNFLVKSSFAVAKELGFKGLQFNMVLSQNQIAVNLYRKFGFKIIGIIPQSIRNPDGSYQDGYIMHREL